MMDVPASRVRRALHSRFAWIVLPTVILMLASVGAVGQAQEGSRYSSLIQNALAEYEAGNWVEAYNFFKSAHRISANARTLRGMGMVSFEMRAYPRALRELKASLESDVNPLTPELREGVHALIERASHLVGTVEVTLQPPEANLLVNHEPRETHEVVVPVGKVHLRAELAGHKPTERVIMVDGRKRYEVSLVLPSVSDTRATREREETKRADAPTRGGAEAVVTKDGGIESSTSTDEDTAFLSALPWISAGSAVFFAGLATTTWLIADAQYDDLQEECREGCSSDRIDDSSVRTWGVLTNVSIGLSVAAAVSSVALFALDADDAEEERETLRVGMGPGSALLYGRF